MPIIHQTILLEHDDKIQSFLQDVSPDNCVLDPLNVRQERQESHVEGLAQSMRSEGYDLTRAVWARPSKDGIYSVFAGGTRLEAAKRAGVNVSIVLHEGYSDDEIVRLTDLDNARDARHIPVDSIQVWAHYAYLRDVKGWTQQQIADTKGIGQSLVSKRLKLHGLSDRIKGFIHQKLLAEAHLIEITQLFIDEYFSPWLTTEQAWEELAEWASGGMGHTVRQTKTKVGQWKSFIELAKRVYEGFREEITLYSFFGDEPESYQFDEREAFLDGLVQREARSQVKIQEAQRKIKLLVAENIEEYQDWVIAKTAEEARRAKLARLEKEILDKYILGDCLDLADNLENKSVRLLLVDPPYGKDFQSNRRVKSPKAPKIVGDAPGEAIILFSSMLETYKPKLQDEAHLLSFCDWQSEPNFRQLIELAGFTIRGSLIWVKENHSAGDLEGTFAPKHDRIIHATLGRPSVNPRIDDVLSFPRDLASEHPTAKPVPLLKKLILSCTNEGDLVIDPLAGCGSTLLAAWNLDRDFWGCEIDEQWHDVGSAKLLQELEEELDA